MGLKKVSEDDRCIGCPMCRLFPNNTLVEPQIGPADILLVGEAPGEQEALVGKPFSGGAGRWLDSALRNARMNREDLNVINVIQCRPPENIFPDAPEARSYISREDAEAAIAHCLDRHTRKFIVDHQWDKIVLLGDKALRYIAGFVGGIFKWRGSPIVVEVKGKRFPAIATLHPAFIARDQNMFPVLVNDLRKSLTPPPEHYNTHPMLETVRELDVSKLLVFDIETKGWSKQISMVGMSTRLFHAVVPPFEGSYIDAIRVLFNFAGDVVGHNCIQFDLPILSANGVAPRPESEIWDTMLMHHLLFPQFSGEQQNAKEDLTRKTSGGHGLEFLNSQFTSKPAWKHGKGEDEELYCFTPDHKLLGTDLVWQRADQFNVGDVVLGFDEEGPNRKYRAAQILEKQYADAPVYRVTLESGKEFKVTADHKWLVINRNKSSEGTEYKWVITENLRPREIYGEGQESKIPKLLEPWFAFDNYWSGWLAGIFDGEGSIRPGAKSITIAQNSGSTLQRIEETIYGLGFNYGKRKPLRKTEYRVIKGSLAERLRFLGSIRPQRLIEKVNFNELGRLECRLGIDSIIRIEPFKLERKIIKIRTDRRTLIVDGYPMHNCARDVDVTNQCYQILRPMLKKEGLEDLYRLVSVPLAKICHLMHERGFKIDPTRLVEIREKYLTEMSVLERQLPQSLRTQTIIVHKRAPAPEGSKTAAGKTRKFILVDAEEELVPWRSNEILMQYFYKDQGLPVQLHVKTDKPTIDKGAVQKLLNRLRNGTIKNPRTPELIAELQAYQKLKKLATLVSGFVQDKLLTVGRQHSHFNVHGTASGRLSSSDPNLQNQPEASRFIYVPSYKDWCLIDCDYSSIENKLTAYFANDIERLARFQDPGFNEHKWTASLFFNLPIEEIEKDNDKDAPYGKAKRINHGSNYGMGPKKISNMYDMPFPETKELTNRWKEINSKTVAWQTATGEKAKREGVLTTPFGRKRWFYTQSYFTEALSFLPQSTAADVIFRAMIGLMYERIGWPLEKVLEVVPRPIPLPRPAELLVQVHDSLVFECPGEMVDETVFAIRSVMEQGWPELGGFNFTTGIKVGNPGESWGELHSYN